MTKQGNIKKTSLGAFVLHRTVHCVPPLVLPIETQRTGTDAFAYWLPNITENIIMVKDQIELSCRVSRQAYSDDKSGKQGVLVTTQLRPLCQGTNIFIDILFRAQKFNRISRKRLRHPDEATSYLRVYLMQLQGSRFVDLTTPFESPAPTKMSGH